MTPNPFIAQFRSWFAYEDDAHAKTLASLESVPAERRSSPEYVRAAGIFAHTVIVRRVWLHRMTDPAAKYSGPAFPDGTDLNAVAALWSEIRGEWDRYFDSLTDTDLARTFDYNAMFGGRFRSRVGDVLPHLFAHSAYHRGQVALLVKQVGGTPAATDFIFSNRETLESPSG